MKIAIQGHSTRFKEVIDTLINLGGINKSGYDGNSSNICYYIDEFKHVNGQFISKINTNSYKCYTLEEFEKEFPFKIGDKVIYDYASDFIGTIVDIKFDDNIPYRVNIKGTICTCGKNTLKPHKMTNPRNITLTLDKAKKWYNKGGELREIALQAFTEKELNPLPKSWEEYCKGYKVPAMIFGPCIPNKYVALWKLEQLRDCYRQGWKPDSGYFMKFCIIKELNTYKIVQRRDISKFLSFQTHDIANEFLRNFEPLIKEAGDLI